MSLDCVKRIDPQNVVTSELLWHHQTPWGPSSQQFPRRGLTGDWEYFSGITEMRRDFEKTRPERQIRLDDKACGGGGGRCGLGTLVDRRNVPPSYK